MVMTLGGVLWVFALMIPVLFSPPTETIVHAAMILRWVGLLVFAGGGCIYARGIGQPVWLGLFCVTFVGLIILLWLPDRFPEPGDGDDF